MKNMQSARTLIVLSCWLLMATALARSQQNSADATGGESISLVTLSMTWGRGGLHYGPNFIWLAAPCQKSFSVPCECAMNFKVIRSQEFAEYISSFGSAPVPVTYRVRYGSDGQAEAAKLDSVGNWQAERFPANDRLISIKFEFKKGQPSQKQETGYRSPADCFPSRN
ncbi:MAG TPA: hypothetical protein VGM18_07435 [Candidatus Sulfotelmatobacter sp.]|jgi:hypothetical protein